MIDIGANIGDTVLMVKSKSDIPILCIEGENKFISYLHKNISKYKNVFVEESFVGDKKSIKGNYILSGGSGRIIEDDKQTEINFKSLEEILTKYPEFKTCKLLKIDTDGFDCRIIKNEIAFIASVKPVIFFEYDPFFYNKENSINVFDLLSEAGYSRAVFYENTGDYLLTTQLRDKELLADLHYYFSGRNMNRYCDIAVFPVEDDNLADKLRDIEIHYFSQIRNYKIN
jgi:FkbM family methyltransferase